MNLSLSKRRWCPLVEAMSYYNNNIKTAAAKVIITVDQQWLWALTRIANRLASTASYSPRKDLKNLEDWNSCNSQIITGNQKSIKWLIFQNGFAQSKIEIVICYLYPKSNNRQLASDDVGISTYCRSERYRVKKTQ